MTFALTWACVAWVYLPELFTTGSRGRGTSMTSATNWLVVRSINARHRHVGGH